jgi:hypothetical protein
LSAHISALQTGRLSRHGEMTQVTFGPLHIGGSAFTGKTKQRHEPHVLSNILQSVLALHDRSGAAGALGMPGSDCLRSGVFGADASSSGGGFMPLGSEGSMLGVPTRVVMGGDSGGRWFSDAAVGGIESDLDGCCVCGASCSGSLES